MSGLIKNGYSVRSILSLFSSDLAIDLGTANTLVYVRGKGVVVNEPSIVAINKTRAEVVAVGREAKEMLGRTPGNVVAIKPMKDGVIADFKVTERMLTYFIQKAHNRRLLVHPRIVIGVPSEITPVEKRAVQDSAYRARASEVFLVEQAMAAVNKKVKLPQGYRLEWAGEYESQKRSAARLAIIVPITIIAIFVILYSIFHSLKWSGLILFNVALAPIGGVLALWITGNHFSVSSGVGFLALFGVSVQTGVILVSYMDDLRRDGDSVGAMSAVWRPHSAARIAERTATIVFPLPTSPWRRRAIGCPARRSAPISRQNRSRNAYISGNL